MILNKYFSFVLLFCGQFRQNAADCKKSITTVTGSRAPKQVCSGALLLDENFKKLDTSLWKHEISLGGGGNWEFQWYTKSKQNSFVKDGKLHIRPSLTSDKFGEAFLSSGKINLNNRKPKDKCTNADHYGCERVGTASNYLNPIRSARLHTKDAFAFKYGKVEVKAKIPSGDWLWPAIWLLPQNFAYGGWPRSGEIDIMEARGNKNLVKNGANIGTQQVGSTLHFGPEPAHNAWHTSHFEKNLPAGFDQQFHKYGLEWTDAHIKFSVDDQVMGTIDANAPDAFWKRGGFSGDNLWKSGSKMAPFDQNFYIILNLAVGGTNYFPDDAQNPKKKPWANTSPNAPKEFWLARNDWLPTWNLKQNNGDGASLIVDYVKVWAI